MTSLKQASGIYYSNPRAKGDSSWLRLPIHKYPKRDIERQFDAEASETRLRKPMGFFSVSVARKKEIERARRRQRFGMHPQEEIPRLRVADDSFRMQN